MVVEQLGDCRMQNTSNVFQFKPNEMGVFFAAEQSSRDYLDFIKNAVLPQIAGKVDLRIRELLTLYCVGSAPTAISLSEIANVMRQDAATLTRSSIVLVGQGMITTSKSFQDSRVKLLHITDAGKEVSGLFHKVMDNALGQIGSDADIQYFAGGEDLYDTSINRIQRRAELLAYEAAIFNKTLSN